MISKVKKYVINLERRTDRLEHIKKELDYIGWDYEIFKAIDTNSHVGCTLSHIEIIKSAKQQGLESVMIIEDDCTFMPFSKDLIGKIESSCFPKKFGIFNLSPTLNARIHLSEVCEYLMDMTNLPEFLPHERFNTATNCLIYHNSVYDKMLELEEPLNLRQYAIDTYISKFVITENQSYCPILPVCPQKNSESDVSSHCNKNFFVQTYNWNLYSPIKIPNEYKEYRNIESIKENNIHVELSL
jgi:GR25 family glycosyltransferase involved in LPS biosynthesis